MHTEEEYHFSCPYCGSKISMLFESLSEPQEYTEDCEVCCRPIVVKFKTSEFSDLNVEIKKTDD